MWEPLSNIGKLNIGRGIFIGDKDLFIYLDTWKIFRFSDFMSNFREMAREWLSKKISKSQNLNKLYLTLKHGILRFQICNYFRQIFKFRDLMNANDFSKYIIVHKIVKFNYFPKVIKYSKSPDHVLQSCT